MCSAECVEGAKEEAEKMSKSYARTYVAIAEEEGNIKEEKGILNTTAKSFKTNCSDIPKQSIKSVKLFKFIKIKISPYICPRLNFCSYFKHYIESN